MSFVRIFIKRRIFSLLTRFFTADSTQFDIHNQCCFSAIFMILKEHFSLPVSRHVQQTNVLHYLAATFHAPPLPIISTIFVSATAVKGLTDP
jgi:hypothetical protein